MKPWYTSLTVIVNGAIGLATLILSDPSLFALIPQEWWPRLMGAQAGLNLLLRYKTQAGIYFKKAQEIAPSNVRPFPDEPGQ